ncbi:MAG: hypothetical protein CMP58_04470 [Flavobacteriales bacterium]|nr:hypothetical protein [Flavobacteriales bacterium]
MLYNYVSVEGNIGSGKTLLASMLADFFEAKLILERFSNNPFLPKFYESPKQNAFPLELFFLAERYNQISKDITSPELFKNFTISDYSIFKSSLFAKVTLSSHELVLFSRLYDIILNNFPKPDLMIYLHSDIERIKKNINDRNREYEKNIKVDYLFKLQKAYHKFLNQTNNIRIVYLDVSEVDFKKDVNVFNKIAKTITTNYSLGLNKINL